MVKVYVVIMSFPDASLVDENAEFVEVDVGKIVGVFRTEEAARKVQEKLINENAEDVIAFGCDRVDVVLEEWEVQ